MSNRYIEELMTNHPLISDSSDDKLSEDFKTVITKQNGGNSNDKNQMLKNMPSGSFPPLFILTKEEKEKEEKNKARTFSAQSSKTILSIKEIMQDRREDNKNFNNTLNFLN